MRRDDRTSFFGRILAPGVAAALFLAGVVAADEVDLAARRQRVLDMTDQQRAELADAQARFDQLDPAKQAAIRQVDRDLASDPNAADLRQVMRRYSEWLDTLPQYTRLELLSLPPEKRMERIRSLLREEEDMRGLQQWVDALAVRVRDKLPADKQAEWDRMLADRRRHEVVFVLFGRELGGRFANQERKGPDKDSKERKERAKAAQLALVDLRSRVSKATADELGRMKPQQQSQWIARKLFAQVVQKHREQAIGGGPPTVSDAELAQFFETLSDTARDALLRLPGKEMYQRLRDEYFRQNRLGPGGPRGPFRQGYGRGPFGDGRPGGGPPDENRSPHGRGPGGPDDPALLGEPGADFPGPPEGKKRNGDERRPAHSSPLPGKADGSQVDK